MRKGIMAFEGLEDEVDAPEAGEFANAPENDLLEMNDARKNMDDTDEGMEEGIDTAAALNKIGDSLGESAENGGMSEPEAEAIKVAVEHMLARVGFPKRMRGMPSMESFGDKNRRVRATMEAMEYVKDKASKIYESIANAMEAAYKWLQEFYKKMKDGVGKLKERAKNMITAAKAKSGEKWEQTKVSAQTFKNWLNVEGKFLSAKEFVTEFASWAKGGTFKDVAAMQEAFIAYGEALEKHITENSFESGDNLSVSESKFNQAREKLTGVMGAIGETKLKFGQAAKWVTKTASGLVSVKIAPSSDAKEVEGALEVEALSPAQVEAVAKEAEAQLKTIEGWEAVQVRLAKVQERIAAALKKAKDKTVSGGEAAYAKTAELCKNFSGMVGSGLSSVKTQCVNTAKAAMDYCGVSLGKSKATDTGEAPAA